MRYISLLFFALFSIPSWAHVRWFVNSTQFPDVSLPIDPLFYSILVAVVGFCLFACIITRQGLLGPVTANPVMTDSFFFLAYSNGNYGVVLYPQCRAWRIYRA